MQKRYIILREIDWNVSYDPNRNVNVNGGRELVKRDSISKYSKEEFPFVFRLYDDDGILYTEGLAISEETIDRIYEYNLIDMGITRVDIRVRPSKSWETYIG